jgi:hypothetical protein
MSFMLVSISVSVANMTMMLRVFILNVVLLSVVAPLLKISLHVQPKQLAFAFPRDFKFEATV